MADEVNEIEAQYDKMTNDVVDVDERQMLKPEYFLHLNLVGIRNVIMSSGLNNNARNGIALANWYIHDMESIMKASGFIKPDSEYDKKFAEYLASVEHTGIKNDEERHNRMMLKKKELLLFELFKRRAWAFPVKLDARSTPKKAADIMADVLSDDKDNISATPLV